MAFVFDMKRLHHGCGESLLVRPLKAACTPTSGKHKGRRKPGFLNPEKGDREPYIQHPQRDWE
jgi:hypothetical protein